MNAEIDIRDVLPTISVPTLVLYRARRELRATARASWASTSRARAWSSCRATTTCRGRATATRCSTRSSGSCGACATTSSPTACSRRCSSPTSSGRRRRRPSSATAPGATCSPGTTGSCARSSRAFAAARSTPPATASSRPSTAPPARSAARRRSSRRVRDARPRGARAGVHTGEVEQADGAVARHRRPHRRADRRGRAARRGARLEHGQGHRRRLGHRVRGARRARAGRRPGHLAPVLRPSLIPRGQGSAHGARSRRQVAWAARFAKTRSAATELVLAGHVKVGGERVKPAREVYAGDTLEIRLGRSRRTVVVTGVADRRGPAKVAATLYEETPESREERERLALERRAGAAARRRPRGATDEAGAAAPRRAAAGAATAVRWVALLRAVNLGARNKVPMAKLRALLEEAGYGDVRTYIASGNVLLDGPRSGATVAQRARADGRGRVRRGHDRDRPQARRARGPRRRPSLRPRHLALARRLPRQAARARPPTPRRRRPLAGPGACSQARTSTSSTAGVQNARLSAARLEQLLGVAATHRNWRTVAALAELAAEA